MCKVYPLNQAEMEELRKNLEKDHAKGFIKSGSSPYTVGESLSSIFGENGHMVLILIRDISFSHFLFVGICG